MGEEKVNKGEKKSKKKVVITVVIIVVLVLLVAGGFIFYHGNQTGKLIAETNKLAETKYVNDDGSLVENPVDMEIKTTGSYAVVEKTLKDYTNEVATATQYLIENLNEERIINLGSIDNIKEDGPDFVKSKEEINNIKQIMNDYISKMESLANEDEVLARIDDKDIGEYYKELYKQLAIDEQTAKSAQEAIDEIKESQEIAEQKLDELENIFDFLSENRNKWQIENDQITFLTEDSYEEFMDLTSSLETME